MTRHLVLVLGDPEGHLVLATYLYKLTNKLGTPSYHLMAAVAVCLVMVTLPLRLPPPPRQLPPQRRLRLHLLRPPRRLLSRRLLRRRQRRARRLRPTTSSCRPTSTIG